jgi:hypothetical protein
MSENHSYDAITTPKVRIAKTLSLKPHLSSIKEFDG